LFDLKDNGMMFDNFTQVFVMFLVLHYFCPLYILNV